MNSQCTEEEVLRKMFGSKSDFVEILLQQLKRVGAAPNKKYDDLDKSTAFTLHYKCGKRGYEWLKKQGWKLPSRRSIQRWLENLKIGPGINEKILECIRSRVSTFKDKEKECILMWDEMRIKKNVQYQYGSDKIAGIVDYGNGYSGMEAASEALVYLVKGLTTSWSFTVSYYLSDNATTTEDVYDFLDDALEALEKQGLKVRVCISDMSFTNQGVFRAHGITESKPYIEKYNRRIYFMHDPCHLIKLIRTHIQRHGYKYSGGVVLWSVLTRFFQIDQSTENRLAPRLRKEHFELTDITRMKVKLATQLLSNSVAAGIETLVDLEIMDESARETSFFIKSCNDMFDMLNISEKHHKNPLKSGLNVFKNIPLLCKFKKWVKTWRCADGARLPDSVEGTIVTLESYIQLLSQLRGEGYKYVLTRKIQQDSLEHYFSHQRFANGYSTNPTTLQFAKNYKILFMTKLLANITTGNCEAQHDTTTTNLLYSELFQALTDAKAPLPSEKPVTSASIQERVDKENNSETESSNIFRNDFFKLNSKAPLGVKDSNIGVYVAGWATAGCVEKSKCKDCINSIFEKEKTKFAENETFLRKKSYTGDNAFTCPTVGSFGQRLTENSKNVFEQVNTSFRNAVIYTLSLQGKDVANKIFNHTMKNNTVFRWVHEPGENECAIHRAQILLRVIVSKIHQLVRDKNSSFKVVKSTATRLSQLRNQ
jgi:hypothetical protein